MASVHNIFCSGIVGAVAGVRGHPPVTCGGREERDQQVRSECRALGTFPTFPGIHMDILASSCLEFMTWRHVVILFSRGCCKNKYIPPKLIVNLAKTASSEIYPNLWPDRFKIVPDSTQCVVTCAKMIGKWEISCWYTDVAGFEFVMRSGEIYPTQKRPL